MKKYVVKDGKEWRYGFTTGSCAAAAACAALEMILTGKSVSSVAITLPGGESALFDIHDINLKDEEAECSVIKDGGDDPDVTTGAKIFAKVSLLEQSDIEIDGGIGVGRVTAEGLRCKVGEAAINPTPRKMIAENMNTILQAHNCRQGARVIISVPEGEKIALQTFNPRLGIIGGISILGTTGIVEPMSEQALIDTIKVLIDKKYAENSEIILISPGNFGKDFCSEFLHLDIEKSAAISNFVGASLDYIKYKGFKKILFVGHTGKLIKVAAGVMNTHSSYADCRMEVVGVHSALAGTSTEKIRKIMECITTDQAFDIIQDEPAYEMIKQNILDKILYHLNFRLKNQVQIEVVSFTTNRKHIMKSEHADEFIEMLMEEQDER